MEDTSEKKQQNVKDSDIVRHQAEEIERLRKENEVLKIENDQLKEEIKHLKKPKWAKPNKNKGNKMFRPSLTTAVLG
jgi:cell division protein FtsB